MTLKTFRKANATLIARALGPEAAAYQAGHSKVSMTQEHYIEELREALDTRSVVDAFKPTDRAGQAHPEEDEVSPTPETQESEQALPDEDDKTENDEKDDPKV